jgi:hypothetical protein
MKENLWVAIGIFLVYSGITTIGISIISLRNKKEFPAKMILGASIMMIGCVIIGKPYTIIGVILIGIGFILFAKFVAIVAKPYLARIFPES